MKKFENMTAAELMGRKVRSIEPLSNGWMSIPPGAIFEVTGKRGGLHLKSGPCKECGVRVTITKVPHFKLEFLPQEDDDRTDKEIIQYAFEVATEKLDLQVLKVNELGDGEIYEVKLSVAPVDFPHRIFAKVKNQVVKFRMGFLQPHIDYEVLTPYALLLWLYSDVGSE